MCLEGILLNLEILRLQSLEIRKIKSGYTGLVHAAEMSADWDLDQIMPGFGNLSGLGGKNFLS